MLTRDRTGSSRPPTVYDVHHVPHGHRNDRVHAEALLQQAHCHVRCGVGEIPAVQISALDEGVGLSPNSGMEAGLQRDGLQNEAESIAKASARAISTKHRFDSGKSFGPVTCKLTGSAVAGDSGGG